MNGSALALEGRPGSSSIADQHQGHDELVVRVCSEQIEAITEGKVNAEEGCRDNDVALEYPAGPLLHLIDRSALWPPKELERQ